MFGHKVKKEIVLEYVNICHICKLTSQNCKDSSEFLQLQKSAESLKTKYELIIFRIGYMDLSFAILKKDLGMDEYKICDTIDLKSLYKRFDVELKKYDNELVCKMKKLSLNNFEQCFINNF